VGELAILHRPLFPGTRPEEIACCAATREVDIDRESIWISYRPLSLEPRGPGNLDQFSHHRLATPVSPWEQLKIGCGTPPVLTRHGWLIVYHGVSKIEGHSTQDPSADDIGKNGHQLCYSAGVMVLSKEHPREIRYRSAKPVLTVCFRQGCVTPSEPDC
jgi:predicted GH43/DUF377 family glycosyl hydrolase